MARYRVDERSFHILWTAQVRYIHAQYVLILQKYRPYDIMTSLCSKTILALHMCRMMGCAVVNPSAFMRCIVEIWTVVAEIAETPISPQARWLHVLSWGTRAPSAAIFISASRDDCTVQYEVVHTVLYGQASGGLRTIHAMMPCPNKCAAWLALPSRNAGGMWLRQSALSAQQGSLSRSLPACLRLHSQAPTP